MGDLIQWRCRTGRNSRREHVHVHYSRVIAVGGAGASILSQMSSQFPSSIDTLQLEGGIFPEPAVIIEHEVVILIPYLALPLTGPWHQSGLLDSDRQYMRRAIFASEGRRHEENERPRKVCQAWCLLCPEPSTTSEVQTDHVGTSGAWRVMIEEVNTTSSPVSWCSHALS